ncbi:MAG: hypothetical protein BJ554DRAFT_1018 [Olpidium bornovanus]|uniref:Uncharacterized protein n=1 Tax=Olpidium bornovanus TaxID=278681 RepID=A0A8H8DHQ5_9FUNG|nr:MAG: hypothetical protein BJ554DRAFT_1018 [Olpidium bornovanus]
MPTSRLTTRRLVDAIVNNTCSIEDAPTSTPATPSQLGSPAGSLPSSPQPIRAARQTSQLWERFTQGLQPLEPGDCYTCGRPGPCAFRFRMADDEPWAPIDGFCRDRVVAACEFYVFIRNLRLGLYGSRSEQDLYPECTRLRLQMFYAKIGALPWSELDRRVPEKPAWADAAPDAKPQQRAAAPPARDLAWAERPPLSPVSDNIQSNGNPNIVINPTSVA